jgi:hypothetical protein
MNRTQVVIYNLCYGPDALVNPKQVAHVLLRMRHDYLSDICRRERVDFPAAINAILVWSETHLDDVHKTIVAARLLPLITDNTRWVSYRPPAMPAQSGGDLAGLCGDAGGLMEDLGGAIRSLARIEADGRVTAGDAPDIEEFQAKSALLIERVLAIKAELMSRAMEARP